MIEIFENSDPTVARLFDRARKGKFKRAVVKLKIDGRAYTSEKLDAERGLDLIPLITYLTASSASENVLAGDYDAMGILSLFGRMARYFVGEGASLREDLLEPLLANVEVGQYPHSTSGGPVNDEFATLFAGEYPHLYRVAMFALLHNFRGFTLGGPSSSGRRKHTGLSSDSSGSDTPMSESSPATSVVDLTDLST